MSAQFMTKIISILISTALVLGTITGFNIPAKTKDASTYHKSEIKNVIYLIGDGMGFNHLEKTKAERNTDLVMDTFPYDGQSRTRSFTNIVTDSAAGGTALACGIRTANSAVGVDPIDKTPKYSYPKNITELCKERGMMTGVITTDETSGVTPASFSAHSSDRDNTEDISNDQLTSDIDLIWGHSNGYVTKSAAEENGFEYIASYDEMMALEEGSRSFAQFTSQLWTLEPSSSNTPTLEQMAVKAVDLLDDTDEGFFLMIEGAHIDKHSHSNDSEKTTEATLSFDRTIKAMLDYAKADGETLVVVTADHETGGLTLKKGEYKYTSDGHTAVNIPVLVYGSDKIVSGGEKLNNYEIPIRIAYTLGFTEDDFPVKVMVK